MSSIVRTGGSNIDRSADFRGLSTDTKPTRAGGQDVPHGSTWYNMDDGRSFMYNADTDVWYAGGTHIDDKATRDSIAPTEEGTTSTRSYAVGESFYIGSTLYEATQAIAIGDELEVGTNCAQAPVVMKQVYNNSEAISDTNTELDAVSDKLDNTVESIAPTEDGATASQSYATDDQFMRNGKLMRATTTITAGTAIVTSGTGQNCEVADSVTGQIADRMTYEDNGVLGAKNRLPYDLDFIKSITTAGTWSNNTYVPTNAPNLSFTFYDDGHIRINGANGTSDNRIWLTDNGYHPFGGMLLSGGINENILLQIHDDNNNVNYNDIGNGVVLSQLINNVLSRTVVIVRKNVTANNVDIYPMLRLATDTDPTYQPYAQTNRELTVTKTDTTVIGTVEDGDKASQQYPVGGHFIRNGKFCTVTDPSGIAQNETLTGSSKFTSRDVASELDRVTGVATNPLTGVTIDSNRNLFVKRNNYVDFTVKVVVSSNLDNSFHTLLTLPFVCEDVKFAMVVDDNSLNVITSAILLNNTSALYVKELNAGTYNISGSYCTK